MIFMLGFCLVTTKKLLERRKSTLEPITYFFTKGDEMIGPTNFRDTAYFLQPKFSLPFFKVGITLIWAFPLLFNGYHEHESTRISYDKPYCL